MFKSNRARKRRKMKNGLLRFFQKKRQENLSVYKRCATNNLPGKKYFSHFFAFLFFVSIYNQTEIR